MVIAPIIIGCGYTYLCEDDFSFDAGARDLLRDYHSSFIGAIHRMAEYYNTNQGTYSFNFLANFLMIYSRFGLPGFHIFMVANAFLFVFELYKLIEISLEDKKISLLILLALLLSFFAMHNTLNNIELFFWYTGGLNFTLGFWLSFLSVRLSASYIKYKTGKISLIISCLAGFIASGFALPVTSANCSLLLIVLIFCYEKIAKRKIAILPFLFAFTGAIINAVAPGNFARSEGDRIEGHSTVFDGIRDTLSCCISESKVFFGSKLFCIILFGLLAICLILKIKIKKKGLNTPFILLTIFGTFLVRFFVMFPVAYGYHMDTMKNMRTTAAYEIVAKLMYIFCIICISQWISEHFPNAIFYFSLLLAGICFLVFLFSVQDIKEDFKSSYTYNAFDDLRSGKMLSSYNSREYILSTLKLSEENSDVIIYVPMPQAASTYGMGLVEDSGWFVNNSAANLYNLKSVTVFYVSD